MHIEWENWALKVLITSGVSSTSVQYTECKRAFYAGAISVLSIIERQIDQPETIAMDTMSSVHQELNQFVEDVKAGRA